MRQLQRGCPACPGEPQPHRHQVTGLGPYVCVTAAVRSNHPAASRNESSWLADAIMPQCNDGGKLQLTSRGPMCSESSRFCSSPHRRLAALQRLARQAALRTAPQADAAAPEASPHVAMPVLVQAHDRAPALRSIEHLCMSRMYPALQFGAQAQQTCEVHLHHVTPALEQSAADCGPSCQGQVCCHGGGTCVAPVVRLWTFRLPLRTEPSDHHTSSCGSAEVLPMNRTQ